MEREYEVVCADGQVALLTITVTDEGVIVDIFGTDDLVGTWAMTAQELAEMIYDGDL